MNRFPFFGPLRVGPDRSRKETNQRIVQASPQRRLFLVFPPVRTLWDEKTQSFTTNRTALCFNGFIFRTFGFAHFPCVAWESLQPPFNTTWSFNRWTDPDRPGFHLRLGPNRKHPVLWTQQDWSCSYPTWSCCGPDASWVTWSKRWEQDMSFSILTLFTRVQKTRIQIMKSSKLASQKQKQHLQYLYVQIYNKQKKTTHWRVLESFGFSFFTACRAKVLL